MCGVQAVIAISHRFVLSSHPSVSRVVGFVSSTYPSMHSKQSSFRTLGDLSEITSSGSVRTYLPPSSSTGGPSSLSCDGVMASLVRAPPARSAVAHPSQWATLLLSPPSLPSSFSLLHLAAPPQHSHTSHSHGPLTCSGIKRHNEGGDNGGDGRTPQRGLDSSFGGC